MSKTNFAENAIINHRLRNTPYTSPAETWIALFTAIADGEAGSVTEVSGGSYARVRVYKDQGSADAVSVTTPYWTTPGVGTEGIVKNARDIAFPVATVNWGTIVGVGVYDAASGGNLTDWGNLASSTVINSTNQAVFQVNQLVVQET